MGCSPELCAAVRDWFLYKAERREMYGATFRRTFFGKITENVSKYGADAVAKLITDSLSRGWKGVAWDKLAENGGGYGREGGSYANGSGGYVAGGRVGANTGGRSASADERWGIG